LLVDDSVVRRLVSAAALSPTDVVADVGAGTGVITREILRRGVAKVYALEVDRRFAPFLEPLPVRWGDALAGDLPDVTKVVANPPFQLTERLIPWLGRQASLESATLVMGASFGRSAVAEPGSADYTRLSLAVRSRFAVELVGEVSRNAFGPPMRTDACIVRLIRRQAPLERMVADAVARKGGWRVKDLLWRLRLDLDVRDLRQRRLQELTNAQLSRLMAAVSASATGRGRR
jgi:16S rRNA (adenine1518-N6/adenine1519-N6)-dimethyltransferase